MINNNVTHSTSCVWTAAVTTTHQYRFQIKRGQNATLSNTITNESERRTAIRQTVPKKAFV